MDSKLVMSSYVKNSSADKGSCQRSWGYLKKNPSLFRWEILERKNLIWEACFLIIQTWNFQELSHWKNRHRLVIGWEVFSCLKSFFSPMVLLLKSFFVTFLFCFKNIFHQECFAPQKFLTLLELVTLANYSWFKN